MLSATAKIIKFIAESMKFSNLLNSVILLSLFDQSLQQLSIFLKNTFFLLFCFTVSNKVKKILRFFR